MDIEGFAARHRGLLRRAVAVDHGLTPRQIRYRVATGSWLEVEPGVYRMAGAPVTWEQRVLVACWAEDGWASHRTAAAIWDFEGCAPRVIEVLVDRWKRRPNPSVRVHETRVLHPDDVGEIDGLPVTSAPRTVLDLAVFFRPWRIESIYHDALNRRLLTPEATWECFERLESPGRPWLDPIKPIIARTIGDPNVKTNEFEKRLLRVLADGGLPLPETQVEIHRPDGTFLCRVDALYRDTKTILEADSRKFHGSWVRRTRDIRLDRELVALGYSVLRFTWEDLTKHADEVVQDVIGARRAASA